MSNASSSHTRYTKKTDAILRKMEDDTWIPEGECAYAEEGEGKSDDSEDEEGSEKELNEEEEEAADLAALFAISGSGDTEDVRSSGYDDVEVVDVNSCGEAPSIGCATKADALTQSQTLIAVLETAMWSLKEVGAQGAVAQITNDIRKEKRRARASSREDQEVLNALARQRDAEMALERTRRLMLQEGKKRAQTAAKLNEEAKAAKARLKKRKREIEDAEAVLEAKHAIKQYSLEELGKGRSRGGGVAAKKRRWEVLDRLARLGQGLSPAQRNDFGWFKDAWDARMLQKHEGSWLETFMGWMQRLLGENEDGVANAFSVFVHRETRRCFDGVPALRVP